MNTIAASAGSQDSTALTAIVLSKSFKLPQSKRLF